MPWSSVWASLARSAFFTVAKVVSNRLERWLYPDAQLARDIIIEADGSEKLPTLRLLRQWNADVLHLTLRVTNQSRYRRVVLERLVLQGEGVAFAFYDEIVPLRGPTAYLLMSDFVLTDRHATWFRDERAARGVDLKLVGTAVLVCDSRTLPRRVELRAPVVVIP